ncbi:MAG TPA: hypothetical protein VK790_09990 [Solirubrobacteraceae bacterium]|nr:hypothetical protein [Solirubrobacteraceae bacterium]
MAFNVTLGQATTNTTNENPGYLNVVAPVSGTATLTNTTTDYTASEAEYPPLEVDALYPSNSPVCGHQGASVPHDGDVPVGHIGRPFSAVVPFYGGDLCTLRVAALHTTLTAACGGDSSEESLAGGQSINLMVEPDGSQGDGAGCDQPDDPGYLVLSGLFPAEAELTVAALRAPPKYWAVFSSDGDTSSCPRSALAAQKKAAGEYSEPPLLPVVTSEPSGLSGCVVGPR